MKKVVLTVLFVFALSSVGLAAPLMDYSKGKASIDYMYRPSLDFDGKVGVDGSEGEAFMSGTMDGKANLDWGITYGIGNNWAVQYRGYNPETDSKTFTFGEAGDRDRDEITPTDYTPYYGLTANAKIKSEEFNVLYKLNKNVAAFAGVVRSNASINIDAQAGNMGLQLGLKSDDNTTAHIGLVGVAKLAPKTHAFGLVSLGGDYRNWEAGLSYEVSKDVDFNVSYRSTKYDDFKFGKLYNPYGPESINASAKDVEVKGWGFGVTCKF